MHLADLYDLHDPYDVHDPYDLYDLSEALCLKNCFWVRGVELM